MGGWVWQGMEEQTIKCPKCGTGWPTHSRLGLGKVGEWGVVCAVVLKVSKG